MSASSKTNAKSKHIVRHSRKANFKAYDAMPQPLRDFCKQTICDVSARDLYEAWENFRIVGIRRFIEMCAANAKTLDAADARALYGPEHPSALNKSLDKQGGRDGQN